MRLRNVAILSVCQAIGFCGVPVVLLIGGIVGAGLAPSPAWATLPITSMVVGTALSTVPAALLMERAGRRLGFVLSAVIAAFACLGAIYAIASASFLGFCLATLALGVHTAFLQQYRFAAAESVERRYAGRAVSLLLVGGAVAGYVGPEIARLTKDLLSYGAYSGSFLVLAGLYALVAVILLFLQDVARKTQAVGEPARPLRTVLAQPSYLAAAWCGIVAYAVMSFVMTATPTSMLLIDHHTLAETTVVIQAHILAMYVPSLFTGFLIDRLGAVRLKLLGVLFMGLSVTLAPLGHHFAGYLVELVLMGLGWNLLFIGGTVSLTRSYRPSERFKAQGMNDLLIFGIQAPVTLAAGWVIYQANWEMLNLLTLPLLLVTFVVVVRTRQVAES